MEHISLAGHPEPFALSETAAGLLRERLEAARERRGAAEAENLETRIGERITTLLEDGMPSIDKATMRSIVDFVETPEEAEPTGIGQVLRGIAGKLPGRRRDVR